MKVVPLHGRCWKSAEASSFRRRRSEQRDASKAALDGLHIAASHTLEVNLLQRYTLPPPVAAMAALKKNEYGCSLELQIETEHLATILRSSASGNSERPCQATNQTS